MSIRRLSVSFAIRAARMGERKKQPGKYPRYKACCLILILNSKKVLRPQKECRTISLEKNQEKFQGGEIHVRDMGGIYRMLRSGTAGI